MNVPQLETNDRSCCFRNNNQFLLDLGKKFLDIEMVASSWIIWLFKSYLDIFKSFNFAHLLQNLICLWVLPCSFCSLPTLVDPLFFLKWHVTVYKHATPWYFASVSSPLMNYLFLYPVHMQPALCYLSGYSPGEMTALSLSLPFFSLLQ